MRLSSYFQSNMDKNTAAFNSYSLGYFKSLPTELMFMIFNKCDVNALCNFVQLSHGCSEICCQYMASSYGCQLVSRTWILPHGNIKGLGKLFSLMTMSLPTKKRVSYALKALSEAQCLWNENTDLTHFPFSKLSLFFHEMVKNWPQEEQEVAIRIIEEKNPMKPLLHAVLNDRPGAFNELEKVVRAYYYNMYIEHEGDENVRAFWFIQLLKPLVFYMQAKLLILLFAPLDEDGNICWNCFISLSDELDHAVYAEVLRQLAKMGGYIKLITRTGNFKDEDGFAILCELTQMPQRWAEPFIAVLLLFCGSSMITKTVKKVFLTGIVSDLPSFIVMCGEILWRYHRSMGVVRSWAEFIVSLLKEETSAHQRIFFKYFQNFADYFGEGLLSCNIRVTSTLIKIFQQHNIYRQSRYPKRKKC